MLESAESARRRGVKGLAKCLGVGSGFGRSRLTINRDAKAGPDASPEQRSVGWLVEEKIRRRMKPHDAVVDRGEVRRTWAWAEIGGLAVLAVATLVTLLVA